MVLHVFTSFLGGVSLCIPYGLYSGTSLCRTTWRTLGGYPGRVMSLLLLQHGFTFSFLSNFRPYSRVGALLLSLER